MLIGPTYFITTDFFRIEPGEDNETNPGRYGKAFANWIAARLIDAGERIEGVIPEDFGWCVMLRNAQYRTWVGCGNRGESTREWGAYIAAEPSLIQRVFERIDARPEVARLTAVLQNILRSAPGVTHHSV